MNAVTRTTFTTSRQLEFFSEEELCRQTGHDRTQWPAVILKELIDNSLDACEEHEISPIIDVRCDGTSIEVADNGPGIPADTVAKMLDFESRTSSRAAYVAPDRGAQGNALKTLVGISHVLGAQLTIISRGILHRIAVNVDEVRQLPNISHEMFDVDRTGGTLVRLEWPACEGQGKWPMGDADLNVELAQTWWIMFGFAAINPHLTICFRWFDKLRFDRQASDQNWAKWKASRPTSPHWYRHDDLVRLAAAYVSCGQDLLVRDFVAMFDGLSRTAKRKAVLDTAGLHRAKLSDLMTSDNQFGGLTNLLRAMQENSCPVKPKSLGIIGREHLSEMLTSYGGADSIRYRKTEGFYQQLPYVLEVGFARLNGMRGTQFVSGANFSAGINDLFSRTRGWIDDLSDEDPVVIFTHLVCPRLTFADRGKGALLL
jgi:DNA topoisomerase VI subunit B